MSTYVAYDSNNSGGSWWLTDKHWKALERGGWKVHWSILTDEYKKNEHKYVYDKDGTPKLMGIKDSDNKLAGLFVRDGRFLGALAIRAYKPNCKSIREAAEDWESITGLSALSAGCACCGQPHTFTLYKDGKYINSGPNTSFEASWS